MWCCPHITNLCNFQLQISPISCLLVPCRCGQYVSISGLARYLHGSCWIRLFLSFLHWRRKWEFFATHLRKKVKELISQKGSSTHFSDKHYRKVFFWRKLRSSLGALGDICFDCWNRVLTKLLGVIVFLVSVQYLIASIFTKRNSAAHR